MSEKLTPAQMGHNLEQFVEDEDLLAEAATLGQKTKREVEESLARSTHDRERAREMGRRAAAEFAKQEAELVAERASASGEPRAVSAIDAPKEIPFPASVRSRRDERRAPRGWIPWSIAAAFAASVGTVAVVEGSAILAFIQGPPVAPPVTPEAAPPLPDPRGKDLVAKASDECRREDWKGCLVDLDRAKEIDPTLAKDPEVMAMQTKAAEKAFGKQDAGDAGGK